MAPQNAAVKTLYNEVLALTLYVEVISGFIRPNV
jgi:hypothetical protein